MSRWPGLVAKVIRSVVFLESQMEASGPRRKISQEKGRDNQVRRKVKMLVEWRSQCEDFARHNQGSVCREMSDSCPFFHGSRSYTVSSKALIEPYS